ncbi:MAG: tetratricopeptide repeat protein, partial [Pseudolabrys sp.]
MRARDDVISLLFLLAVVAPRATASAQTQQQIDLCAGKNGVAPDLQISSCTAMIGASKETTNNLAIVYSNRGRAFGRKGQYDRAIEDLDRAIKLNPNLSWAFLIRGNFYARKMQYDQAIQDYDQTIKLNPDYALAFSNRGGVYAFKQQYDRAIEDLDQAIKLDPNIARAFSFRGNAYASKKQYDRAIQDY